MNCRTFSQIPSREEKATTTTNEREETVDLYALCTYLVKMASDYHVHEQMKDWTN